MTPKQFVRSRYPLATADRKYLMNPYRIVYVFWKDDNEQLFVIEAETEAKAWTAAKNKIIAT